MPLTRALSKLNVLSRADATRAIRAGRVTVGGEVVTNPFLPVVPERTQIRVDGVLSRRPAFRAVLFHKPRGVISTRKDSQGRPTIFDLLGDAGRGLIAVGRLDAATTGLMVLTTDTRLADWIARPQSGISRVYVVKVRGRMTEDDCRRLLSGVIDKTECLRAHSIRIRKASSRESHVVIELVEGKNREIRRMLAAVDHEVLRLKRVSMGGLTLGDLPPGAWRELTADEIRAAFPGAPVKPHG